MLEVEYPIPGNDSSKASIAYFAEEILKAVEDGKIKMMKKKEESATKEETK